METLSRREKLEIVRDVIKKCYELEAIFKAQDRKAKLRAKMFCNTCCDRVSDDEIEEMDRTDSFDEWYPPCQGCKLRRIVNSKEMTSTAKLRETMFCDYCRDQVTDDDIEEMHRFNCFDERKVCNGCNGCNC